MQIDTSTVVVVGILIDVVLLFILIHTWRTRTTYPGFVTWICGTACWTVGSMLTLLMPALCPIFISKIIGNFLILMHPLLLCAGIKQFYGIRRCWWENAVDTALLLLNLIFLFWFIYVVDSLPARSILLNISLSFLFARVALNPLWYAEARKRAMQWMLSITILPVIALLMVRIWYYSSALLSPADTPSMIAQDAVLRYVLLYGVVVELVIAYSYLSLTSDRVEDELMQSENNFRNLSADLKLQVEEETKRRMDSERLMAHNARLAAMGEMISVIAHQWRQPLATLGMIVQRVYAMGGMNVLTSDYLTEFKLGAMRQIKYMSDTIEGFRSFYRPGKSRELYSPFSCISDAVRLFEPQLTSNGIEVHIVSRECDEVLIGGYPNEFKQVILNLLGNARDAILENRKNGGQPEHGAINVDLVRAGDGDIVIDVRNNGCGIKVDVAHRIFDPYYTTKGDAGGTGIGLYISRKIVEDSLGGRLLLLPGQNNTTFRIELARE